MFLVMNHKKLFNSKIAGKRNDIAVVGIGCRFPEAKNYNEFWKNLELGKNSIKEIPKDRWDIEKYYSPDVNEPNKTNSKWCGLIDDIDKFDAQFFNISPREAKQIDPQQRILLEETYHAIEDSGIPLENLQKEKTSVYIGVMAIDYQQEIANSDIDSYACLGNYEGILANRLSYVFGFNGASMSIDTACASSLVCIHEARKALERGECKYALAGGVSLDFHPWKYISFSKSRMLSPDGQCKTFDKDANGYVPGEGVGVVILQRLEDAILEKNHIYGIIKGSAINHTGETNSITAPKVETQQDVILSAYQDAGISPENVTYVEAHGTGTSLGDPIEIEGLTQAFRKYSNDKQYCQIGSVKTNIGHLEAAAGIAGLIKILMMIKARKIPKTLNIKTINPIIHFEETPFKIALDLCNWEPRKKDELLRGSVSSFGMGGVNSHILVEEYKSIDENLDTKNNEHENIFVLSAKTESSLKKLIEKWKIFSKNNEYEKYDLHDICATLLTSRQNYGYKYGFTVKTKDELKKNLENNLDIINSNNKENCCLKIGELEYSGYDEIKKIFDKSIISEIFYNKLKTIEEECVVLKELRQRTWNNNLKSVNSFVINYVYVKTLIDLGFNPNFIISEKQGIWLNLAISEIINYKDVIEILAGTKQLRDIKLSRPKIPIHDPVNNKMIMPYNFKKEYFEKLFKDIEITESEINEFVEKMKLLQTSQFTFKKYLEEWDEELKSIGISIDDLNNKENSKILLILIILSSLSKLNKKWSLRDNKKIKDKKIYELIQLISDEILTKKDVIELFTSEKPDYKIITDRINIKSTQFKIEEKNDYKYLKELNKELEEIENPEEWINKCLVNFESKNLNYDFCLKIGNTNAKNVENKIFLANTNNISQLLLELWQNGIQINWNKIYKYENFNKAVLPNYEFEGKRFWIEKNTNFEYKNDVKTLSNISKLKLIKENTYQRQYSLQDKIIKDHSITGKFIVPAASMIEMCLESINGLGVTNLKNIVIQKPIIVDKNEIAHTSIEENKKQISILNNNNIVCNLEYNQEKNNSNLFDTLNINKTQQITNIEDIYNMLKQKGYEYGKGLNIIKNIFKQNDQYLFELVDETKDEGNVSKFSPRLLDGIFQTAIVLQYFLISNNFKLDNTLVVPYIIKSLSINGELIDKCYVVVNVQEKSKDLYANFKIYDSNCKNILIIENMILKSVPNNFLISNKEKTDVSYYKPVWIKDSLKATQNKNDFGKPIIFKSGNEISIDKYENSHIYIDLSINKNILNKEQLIQEQEKGIENLFLLCKTLSNSSQKKEIQIIIVTSDMNIIADNDTGYGYVNGSILGFAQTVMLENPKLKIKIIDLEKNSVLDEKEKYQLALNEMLSQEPELITAYRNNERYIRKIQKFEDLQKEDTKILKDNGVYLLVGGMGGIGLEVTKYISQNTNAKIILLGRSKLSDDKQKILNELNNSKENVIFMQADITNFGNMTEIIQIIKDKYKTINGVIHLGGLLEDKILINKDLDSARRVMSPKIEGTWILNEVTKNEPLDFFVVFSSIIGIIGNIGQVDYAGANSFIDSFIQYRKKNNYPGKSISIDWTLWGEVGMGLKDTVIKQLEKKGLPPLPKKQGIDSFVKILGNNESQIIVLKGEGKQVFGNEDKKIKVNEEQNINLYDESQVLNIISEVLSVSKEEIDKDVDISDYGIDSIGISDIVDKLSKYYGDHFHHAIVLENPTVNKLNEYIKNNIKNENVKIENTNIKNIENKIQFTPNISNISIKAESNDIAVIGMSGRFPGSKNIDIFWENLKQGKHLITEIPKNRFLIDPYFDETQGLKNKTYSRWGGFLDDISCFDAEFFKIKDEDAIGMDPQQRIFLEVTQELWDRAGYVKDEIAGKNIGVFIGGHESNYEKKNKSNPKYYGRNGIVNVIPNMIIGQMIQYYDLKGRGEMVYTACSSSLVAIHNACQALRLNEIDMAVAGGIELILDEEWFIGFSASKVLSPDGKCKVFDRSANGFVLGEGVGIVLLKKLDKAIQDKDNIIGVIRGSAINNDGQTMGLTTPNIEAQKSVIKKVLNQTNINPETITYYEAHGTGTSLGDPIEVKAITEVYRSFTDKKNYCAIGSVKSNIGHTLAGAGIASLIKVLLSLKNKQIVPTINCAEPHPRFEFEKTPFYPNMNLQNWKEEQFPRRAGISSFGFGGTNCHLIVEEYKENNSVPARKSKDITQFNRKYYWFDEEIINEKEKVLKDIFEELEKGLITKEIAKQKIQASGITI
jgi:acyl transferase domain-containing protein/acyl carrier protein